MRTVALLLLGVVAVGSSACARTREPATQGHVQASAKLRVRFKSAFAAPPVDMSEREASDMRAAMDAERAVVERLRAAGYDIAEHGAWDVRMELTIRVHRDDHADAMAVFYDHKDRVVDRIALATESKRVATDVASGVRDSKKLTAYAESRKAKR